MNLTDSAPPASVSRDAIVALFLALGAGLLYLPTLSCGFINLDDFQYILENPYVCYPSWQKLRWFFAEWRSPTTVAGYYQPLTMASLMLDRIMEGTTSATPEPFVYHATNVVLHMANVALVYAWIRTFVPSWPAAFAAALFAVHPMNVEAVTWICQRKTLLATLFSITTLLAYGRFVRSGRRGWLFAATLSLAAALLSKPTAWSLPVYLLLLDLWPYRRWSWRRIVEKLPMLMLAGLIGWVAYVSQDARLGTFVPDVPGFVHSTWLILSHNTAFYFYKLLWPFPLCPQYPAPPIEAIRLSNPTFAAGVAVVVLLATVLAVFRRRAVWVCLIGYIVLINPVVLGAIQFAGSLTGDRFVYLPMIALLLGGAALVTQLPPRVSESAAAFGITVVVILGLSWKTWTQQAVWANSITYWQDVIRQFPNDAASRICFARAWMHYDNPQAAEHELAEAIRLKPDGFGSRVLMGQALIDIGRPERALPWLMQGLDLRPDEPEANFLAGRALGKLGRYAEAVPYYQRTVAQQSSFPEALYNLGNALLRTGRARDALPHYERLVLLIPDKAEYLYNYAIALVETGQDSRGYAVLGEAIRVAPENPAINFAFAACAAGAGDTEAAWRALVKAVRGDAELLNLAESEPRFASLRRSPLWGQLRPVSGAATQSSTH